MSAQLKVTKPKGGVSNSLQEKITKLQQKQKTLDLTDAPMEELPLTLAKEKLTTFGTNSSVALVGHYLGKVTWKKSDKFVTSYIVVVGGLLNNDAAGAVASKNTSYHYDPKTRTLHGIATYNETVAKKTETKPARTKKWGEVPFAVSLGTILFLEHNTTSIGDGGRRNGNDTLLGPGFTPEVYTGPILFKSMLEGVVYTKRNQPKAALLPPPTEGTAFQVPPPPGSTKEQVAAAQASTSQAEPPSYTATSKSDNVDQVVGSQTPEGEVVVAKNKTIGFYPKTYNIDRLLPNTGKAVELTSWSMDNALYVYLQRSLLARYSLGLPPITPSDFGTSSIASNFYIAVPLGGHIPPLMSAKTDIKGLWQSGIFACVLGQSAEAPFMRHYVVTDQAPPKPSYTNLYPEYDVVVGTISTVQVNTGEYEEYVGPYLVDDDDALVLDGPKDMVNIGLTKAVALARQIEEERSEGHGETDEPPEKRQKPTPLFVKKTGKRTVGVKTYVKYILAPPRWETPIPKKYGILTKEPFQALMELGVGGFAFGPFHNIAQIDVDPAQSKFIKATYQVEVKGYVFDFNPLIKFGFPLDNDSDILTSEVFFEVPVGSNDTVQKLDLNLAVESFCPIILNNLLPAVREKILSTKKDDRDVFSLWAFPPIKVIIAELQKKKASFALGMTASEGKKKRTMTAEDEEDDAESEGRQKKEQEMKARIAAMPEPKNITEFLFQVRFLGISYGTFEELLEKLIPYVNISKLKTLLVAIPITHLTAATIESMSIQQLSPFGTEEQLDKKQYEAIKEDLVKFVSKHDLSAHMDADPIYNWFKPEKRTIIQDFSGGLVEDETVPMFNDPFSYKALKKESEGDEDDGDMNGDAAGAGDNQDPQLPEFS